jgi:hypothetical protein
LPKQESYNIHICENNNSQLNWQYLALGKLLHLEEAGLDQHLDVVLEKLLLQATVLVQQVPGELLIFKPRYEQPSFLSGIFISEESSISKNIIMASPWYIFSHMPFAQLD